MTAGPDTKKVTRQVEYYFGDSNLNRDKFLQGECEKDDGWVPLEIMLKFKRLGDMVLGDGKQIIASLKAHNPKLIEISSDECKIRRNPEMKVPAYDDNYKRLQKARSSYVKGFGVDDSLDSIQDFFDPFGVESVYMRRVPLSKQFKGSVFVTFKTQKEADDFMNQPETKFKDAVLTKMTKTAYFEQKKDEQKPGRKEKREKNGSDENSADRDEGALERIVKFTGVTDATVGREEIKEKITEVDFTSFERGKDYGYLMVNKGQTAKQIVAAMEENPVQILGAEKVEFTALEGDEATKAFQTIKDDREALFAKLKSRKGNKKGGRQQKKIFNKKNTKLNFNDDAADEEPAEKKVKVDE